MQGEDKKNGIQLSASEISIFGQNSRQRLKKQKKTSSRPICLKLPKFFRKCQKFWNIKWVIVL